MERLLIFLLPLLVTIAAEPSSAANAPRPQARSSQADPIRIGLDTSHSLQFTRTINAPDAEGLFALYDVVVAYPDGSRTIESSYERTPGYIEEMKVLGVDVHTNTSAPRRAAAAGTQPNILFVFTDDHATHAIGAYNERLSDIAPTPNIDRLANEGMLFRNAFVTNSICAPSRAVILTGRHSHLNGVIDNREAFDGSQVTFPKLLREAGYTTAIVGKWHLKSDPTGFDYWNVLPGQGSYYNPGMIENGVRKEHTGYVTDIITDETLEWLQQERDDSKPFMLMYQHKAPHRNWQPGPEHLTLFDDTYIPEPSTLLDPWIDRTIAADWQAMSVERHLTENDLKLVPPGNLNDEQLPAWIAAYAPKNRSFGEADLRGDDLTRWKYQRYMKDYLRTIASVDDNLGRVLDYLDESGLAENTIVVYSSDQGFYLGEHGWFDKRWMYEESLRMPLIVRWPGVTEAGSVNTELVQNLDFAQTFLDAAGASMPAEMQGRSLVPLLKGESPADWRDAVYYHYYEFPGWHDVRRHYGVRTDRFKLIHYYGIDEWELFDLEHDPDELDNVYGDAGYGNVSAQLKQKIAELQDRYDLDEYEESPTAPDPRNVAPEQVLSLSPSSLPLQVGEEIDPTYRPLAVTARVRPSSGNGVIFSHGGDAMGYSLYLEEGRPHFVINNRRVYFHITGANALPQNAWTNIAASIDQEGVIRLYVDGSEVDQANGNLMSARPAERIVIGDDANSAIIDYGFDTLFSGAIENVALHWGVAR